MQQHRELQIRMGQKLHSPTGSPARTRYINLIETGKTGPYIPVSFQRRASRFQPFSSSEGAKVGFEFEANGCPPRLHRENLDHTSGGVIPALVPGGEGLPDTTFKSLMDCIATMPR